MYKLYIIKSPVVLKIKVKTINYGVKTHIHVKVFITIVGKFTILLFFTKPWPGLLYRTVSTPRLRIYNPPFPYRWAIPAWLYSKTSGIFKCQISILDKLYFQKVCLHTHLIHFIVEVSNATCFGLL